jgi:two-component system sensor histidine kinase BaeS
MSTSFDLMLSQANDARIAGSSKSLVTLYEREKSWDLLYENPDIWENIADPRSTRPFKRNNNPSPSPREETNTISTKIVNDETIRPSKPAQVKPPTVPFLPSYLTSYFGSGLNLSLYDKQKNVIAGIPIFSDNERVEPVISNNEIIAWLGVSTANNTEGSPANNFLARQYKSYYYVGFAAITLTFIMAWVVSARLVAPIKKVIAGTNQLIKGRYQSRISASTHDEIGTLTEYVNNLASTLEKNQQNRFQWMSNTSHELRTPLTVLKAQMQAIKDGIFSINEKRIDLFMDQIDNLNQLVDDLYQLSSSDAGALTYKKVHLNPVILLKQIIDVFQPKFSQKSLIVNNQTLNKINCQMLADKERLSQLFTNLLENCYRYTSTGGTINVQANTSDNQLTIEIQDSAPGVTSTEHDKIFDRFFRVEQSRNRDHGGSGLGLSLCRQIVEAHEGVINAGNSPLGGLSIKIIFPIQ